MIDILVILLVIFITWWLFWLACGLVMAAVRGLSEAWHGGDHRRDKTPR